MIRIAIISDHKLASSGIAALLQQEAAFEVCGPVNFEDWRPLLPQMQPDLFLLISRRRGSLPGQLIGHIRQVAPRAKAVFVSLVDDEEALLSALRSGVEGVLDAGADAASLLSCVHDVSKGEIVISRDVARKLMGEYSALVSRTTAITRTDVLTSREIAILRLIAEGETNKAIARHLSISEHTVRAHARNIMRKLEVVNRVQAAAVALRTGLAAS